MQYRDVALSLYRPVPTCLYLVRELSERLRFFHRNDQNAVYAKKKPLSLVKKTRDRSFIARD